MAAERVARAEMGCGGGRDDIVREQNGHKVTLKI